MGLLWRTASTRSKWKLQRGRADSWEAEERDGHQKSSPTMNWVNQFVTASNHQLITHPGTSLCHMDTVPPPPASVLPWILTTKHTLTYFMEPQLTANTLIHTFHGLFWKTEHIHTLSLLHGLFPEQITLIHTFDGLSQEQRVFTHISRTVSTAENIHIYSDGQFDGEPTIWQLVRKQYCNALREKNLGVRREIHWCLKKWVSQAVLDNQRTNVLVLLNAIPTNKEQLDCSSIKGLASVKMNKS